MTEAEAGDSVWTCVEEKWMQIVWTFDENILLL